MSRWLVAQGDRQFAARDLEELRELAQSGSLSSSDMVQPPGATDWLYAGEIPELRTLFAESSSDYDDDISYKKSSIFSGTTGMLLLAVVALGAGGFFWQKYNDAAQTTGLRILGEGGILLTEMLVIGDDVPIYDKPDGATLKTLGKSDKVTLVAKRGEWYKVSTLEGMEGYMSVETVLPGYQLADEETRADYDPIYNPDQYVTVRNTGWIRLDPDNPENTTLGMLVANTSKFDMTGMVVIATLKDKNERELQKKEIRVEGTIPAKGDAYVGTLVPPAMDRDTLEPRIMTNHLSDELLKEEDYKDWQWQEALTMQVDSLDAVSGRLDLTELTAVPKAEE